MRESGAPGARAACHVFREGLAGWLPRAEDWKNGLPSAVGDQPATLLLSRRSGERTRLATPGSGWPTLARTGANAFPRIGAKGRHKHAPAGKGGAAAARGRRRPAPGSLATLSRLQGTM